MACQGRFSREMSISSLRQSGGRESELTEDIIIRIEGRAGRITLNRPKALNSLTREMLEAIDRVLDEWRHDDRVALVLIDAAGDRAFAAGGDIDAVDHYSMVSPLSRACADGKHDLVKRILALGARLDNPPQDGCRPIDRAKANGHDEIVKLLESESR